MTVVPIRDSVPSASEEYERALLGAVLEGYYDLNGLTRIVAASDFYRPEHEEIWQAILDLHQAGTKPNPLTVKDQLGAAALRLPGGPIYLSSSLTCPAPFQAPFYAGKVREAHIRRQIVDLGTRCLQMESDLDLEPEERVAQIRRWADEVGSVEAPTTSGMEAALEEVIDVAQRGEKAATPTPWADLNHLIDGWYPGQLIVIGARPGVGKSIFLENAATDVARRGRRVLFCSLEMWKKELVQRTMAHTAKVELGKLRRGQGALTEFDWERINAAYPKVLATPMTFDDRKRQTLQSIRSAAQDCAREAKRNGEKLGMIVIDYLQLVTPRDNKISRQQQVGEISRGLKMLAGEFEVPVLAGAQLNRAPAMRSGGIPVLSDLREAGDIEQDADDVIFLHEEEVEDGGKLVKTGDLDVIVAKQRHGPLGTVKMQRHGHYGRIS